MRGTLLTAHGTPGRLGQDGGMQVTVRPAEPHDVPEIIAMIRELAEYERALDEVLATDRHLHGTLFAPQPSVFGHVAEVDGELAGMAVWFLNYSTWLGTHGIYLEDLYVRPAHRQAGVGRHLLRTLARLCEERGYPRLEWWVLDWNAPARDFYEAVGAQALTEWVPYRLSGAALADLARHGTEAR
jgi:GNAT superfamily N-acetyltransferase